MKRRRFIQTLAVTPAAALPVVAEARAEESVATLQRSADETPKLETAALDAVGETAAHYFSAPQFAALRKVSDLLMPPLNDLPGALAAGVPEFLDFLISKSPADRQQIYKAGLDALNAQALRQFKKPFADVTAEQAGTLLAPLRQPWTYEPPADPLARFLREAKADVRNATLNSHEYITASAANGRRGGGTGQYWYPID